jgi:hypothetical protein
MSGELRRSLISFICRAAVLGAFDPGGALAESGAAANFDASRIPRARRHYCGAAGRRMNDLGFSSLWEPAYTHVTDCYARMQARPAFQRTCDTDSRMSKFPPLPSAFKEEITRG